MISSVPSPKPGEGDTFHFPEIMLNVITSDVHDSEALCPEVPRSALAATRRRGKVVNCRIRKAKKAHLRQAGEVTFKA